VIVTFVDPHCTTFCPRESVVLNDALRSFPVVERRRSVAVSATEDAVGRRAAERGAPLQMAAAMALAVGSAPQLNSVWRS